jgi:hypothetical protein
LQDAIDELLAHAKAHGNCMRLRRSERRTETQSRHNTTMNVMNKALISLEASAFDILAQRRPVVSSRW